MEEGWRKSGNDRNQHALERGAFSFSRRFGGKRRAKGGGIVTFTRDGIRCHLPTETGWWRRRTK
jgi:hypothetical protein